VAVEGLRLGIVIVGVKVARSYIFVFLVIISLFCKKFLFGVPIGIVVIFFSPDVLWTYNLYFRREDSLIVIIIHMDRTV